MKFSQGLFDRILFNKSRVYDKGCFMFKYTDSAEFGASLKRHDVFDVHDEWAISCRVLKPKLELRLVHRTLKRY